jgi:hypothetical protein
MKVLDSELEDKPTEASVAEMAETRIRNLLCFEELDSFNLTGRWKNRHPLLTRYSERFKLAELKKKDPEAFLCKYAACSNNIKRYKSYLHSEGRSSRRDSDKKNLEKHMDMKVIFESILKDEER